MKNFILSYLLLIALTTMTLPALAVNQYTGEIKLSPAQTHAEVISGKIQLGFPTQSSLKYVDITLEKPLFGRTHFIGGQAIGYEHFDMRQISGAYYLDGTPHQFMFAFVASYNCLMGRLEGIYFRVEESREIVKQRMSTLVDVYDLPETWIPVGNIWLAPVEQPSNAEPTSHGMLNSPILCSN